MDILGRSDSCHRKSEWMYWEDWSVFIGRLFRELCSYGG